MSHAAHAAAAAPKVSDLFGLVGAHIEGKYEVEAAVAEGGFAVVYRGVHRSLRKPVALKVLKVPAELVGSELQAFLKKFEEEAHTIARVEHPAVVRVLDFGASVMPSGVQAPWMVLEWLEGDTLDVELARTAGRRRTPAEVLALLQPVFEAMAFAHEEGVVHRDIKPANMVLARDRRGVTSLRLLDFGIAKVIDAEAPGGSGHTATRAAFRAFSPPYAAPEQISGTRTGPWTDVHALALVTVEALTGHAPYAQHDPTALYADVLSPTRPTPAKFGFDVGPWELVLARALALMAPQRYPNARAFLDDLKLALPTPDLGLLATVRASSAPLPATARVSVAPTALSATVVVPAMVTTPLPTPSFARRVVATALVVVVLGLGGMWWLSSTPSAQPVAAAPAPTPALPIVEPALVVNDPPLQPVLPPVVTPAAPAPTTHHPPRPTSTHPAARLPARSANGTLLLSPE